MTCCHDELDVRHFFSRTENFAKILQNHVSSTVVNLAFSKWFSELEMCHSSFWIFKPDTFIRIFSYCQTNTYVLILFSQLYDFGYLGLVSTFAPTQARSKVQNEERVIRTTFLWAFRFWLLWVSLFIQILLRKCIFENASYFLETLGSQKALR